MLVLHLGVQVAAAVEERVVKTTAVLLVFQEEAALAQVKF
jgi:hypothetical protein